MGTLTSIQVKIGKIASALALFIVVLNTIATVTKTGANNHSFTTICIYFVYAVAFFITAKINNHITKIFQIVLLGSISIYMAYTGSNFPAFLILFVCLSLLYMYGLYKEHVKIKIGVSIITVWGMFVLSPAYSHNILAALSWTALFFAFSLMLWYIYSEAIQKAQIETSTEKLTEYFNKSITINEKLLSLTKEMAARLEEKQHGKQLR